MDRSQITVRAGDPLRIQLEHFCRVVQGQEEPAITARDGAESLAVALAVQQSASRRVPASPSELLSGVNA